MAVKKRPKIPVGISMSEWLKQELLKAAEEEGMAGMSEVVNVACIEWLQRRRMIKERKNIGEVELR